MSVHLYTCRPYVCPLWQLAQWAPIYQTINLSIYLSINQHIYLSIYLSIGQSILRGPVPDDPRLDCLREWDASRDWNKQQGVANRIITIILSNHDFCLNKKFIEEICENFTMPFFEIFFLIVCVIFKGHFRDKSMLLLFSFSI